LFEQLKHLKESDKPFFNARSNIESIYNKLGGFFDFIHFMLSHFITEIIKFEKLSRHILKINFIEIFRKVHLYENLELEKPYKAIVEQSFFSFLEKPSVSLPTFPKPFLFEVHLHFNNIPSFHFIYCKVLLCICILFCLRILVTVF
jgi:hypothetical protein